MKGFQGNKFSVLADYMTDTDPRVTPLRAKKGSLVRYIPDIGDPVMLLKTDNGSSTNFVEIANGTQSLITGIVNPDQAPGVAADEGVLYINTASPSLWQKTGPGDQDWVQFDKTTGDQYILTTNVDPSLPPGLSAPVGALALFTQPGATTIYQKDDAGDEDWIMIGGGTVTGDPFAIARFDLNGDLISNDRFRLEAGLALQHNVAGGGVGGSVNANQPGSFAHGAYQNGGQISTTGIASRAHGFADGASSTIDARKRASRAHGVVTGDSIIIADGVAAEASGQSEGASTIESTGLVSKAHGLARNGGTITSSSVSSIAIGIADNASIVADGEGSFASGSATGANSRILAHGDGSQATGYVDQAGQIVAAAFGSHVFGNSQDPNSQIVATASANGSLVHGVTGNGALISSSGFANHVFGRGLDNSNVRANPSSVGTLVFGRAATTSNIEASDAFGSLVFGNASDSSRIQVNASGSLAFGVAQNSASILTQISASGSLAFGEAQNGGIITTSSTGSMAFGKADSGVVLASGKASFNNSSVQGGNSFVSGDNSSLQASVSNGNVTLNASYSRMMGRSAGGSQVTVSGSFQDAIVDLDSSHNLSLSGLHSRCDVIAADPGASTLSTFYSDIRFATNGTFDINVQRSYINAAASPGSSLNWTVGSRHNFFIGLVSNGDVNNLEMANSFFLGEEFTGQMRANSFTHGIGHDGMSENGAKFGKYSTSGQAALKVGNGSDGLNRSDAVVVEYDGKQKFGSREYVNYRKLIDTTTTIVAGEKIFFADPANASSVVTLPANPKDGEIIEGCNVSIGFLNVQPNVGQFLAVKDGTVTTYIISPGKSCKFIYSASDLTWFALGGQ